MLQVTTKVQYGIRAVIELAKNYDQGLLKTRDIVELQGVPKNYLEQILNQLLKAGIVKSRRGTKGGYELARNPSKISLLTVLETLEGETRLSNYQGPKSVEKLYLEIITQTKTILDISLAELVLKEKEKQGLMFHI